MKLNLNIIYCWAVYKKFSACHPITDMKAKPALLFCSTLQTSSYLTTFILFSVHRKSIN